jgi:hypothetical protein
MLVKSLFGVKTALLGLKVIDYVPSEPIWAGFGRKCHCFSSLPGFRGNGGNGGNGCQARAR